MDIFQEELEPLPRRDKFRMNMQVARIFKHQKLDK